MTDSVQDAGQYGGSTAQAASKRGLWRRAAATLQTSTGETRVPQLDGIRGYAVFLVFLVHHHTLFGGYLLPGSFWFNASRFAHTIGNSGVDLFFVLSGYLIYGHLFRAAPKYSTFLGRRIQRIYPTFLVVFASYVLLSYLFPAQSKLPAGGGERALYLLENLLFLPGLFPIEPLVTVAWSLSYEFFFYLTIPLVLGLTAMRGWRRRERLTVFVTFIAVYCMAYQFHRILHVRMTMFVAGMVAYEMVASGWARKAGNATRERAVFVLYVVMLATLGFVRFGDAGTALHPSVPALWSVLLSFTLCGLVVLAVTGNGVISRLFNLPALRWLGSMSYSYFLVHGLALNGLALALRLLLPGGAHSTALFAAIFITSLFATLAVSLVLFILVERPLSLNIKERAKAAVSGAHIGSGAALVNEARSNGAD